MKIFFSRKTFIIILAAILTAVIAIVSLNTGGSSGAVTGAVNSAVDPLRSVAAGVARMFQSIYGYMYEYDKLVAENDELKARIAKLTRDYRESSDLAAEVDRLNELLDFARRNADFKMDKATVISSSSSSNWSSSFTISKGSSNSKIRVGDAVITEAGILIGRVSDVGATSSTVITIIDTAFSAGILIGKKGDSGTVVGDFTLMRQGLCKIDYITDDTDIVVGDTIVTSGKGGFFPKGLVLGDVTGVQRGETGLDRYAAVKPAVDYKNLSNVYFIIDFEILE